MRALLPLLLGLLACWSLPAQAQVRRCVSPEGSVIYTDRRCDELGAIDQPKRQGVVGNTRRPACARTLDDLVFELNNAIISNDANRLLGLYHWAGLTSAQAYAIVPRLDAIANRPLVDIVPVMARGPEGEDGDYYPQTSVRRLPVALRVEQTLANGATPSRAVFGLQRHLGCWWLRG